MRLVSGLYHYDGKVVVSGDIIEIYRYERGVFKGYVNERGRAGNGFITDEQREKNREVSLMRARRELRRIVNANIGQWGDDVTCKFVTLTFRDNVKDLDKANYEFKKFIQRLNYEVYGRKCSGLKYTVVPEFQERGAVHYHVIFYNLPYTKADVIEKVWGNGFIKINKIDNIDNVGAYICKYLTKGNDDERFIGRKCYFNSRGLKKPVEVFLDDCELEVIKKSLLGQAMTYKGEFENEYVGKIEYEQYNLSISRNQDFDNVNIAARMQRKGD